MAKPFKVKKTSPDDPAESAAARILKTRLREFYSHWPDPDERPSAEQLHSQRISGKRLRYSAETLRDLYPDRLALLIDLLKRATGSAGLDAGHCHPANHDLDRPRTASPSRASRAQITTLESLLIGYNARHSELFTDLLDIWRGMTQKQFRELLVRIVSRPNNYVKKPRPQAEFIEAASPVAVPSG
jgi:hypothetical protein